MFKKPHRAKPAASLKNSEIRKIRADIVAAFNVQPPEDGTLVVPDGLSSAKFNTNSGESGTLYIEPETGNPVWFTVGKNGTYIPTVYTLWKRPLLPHLSTPGPALENIFGGADLMIPGVISISHPVPGASFAVPINSLVAVTKTGQDVPVGVGKLLLPLQDLVSVVKSEEDVKGKAVNVLHVYEDSLWKAGNKGKPPTELPSVIFPENLEQISGVGDGAPGQQKAVGDPPDLATLTIGEQSPQEQPDGAGKKEMTTEEIDEVLQLALLQCLKKTLPNRPEAIPCPASTFLTAYLQPARPFGSPPIDIKKSSYKNLTKFLKAMEKDELLKAKENRGIVIVMSVELQHPDVISHTSYTSVGEVEEKDRRKAQKQKAAANAPVQLEVRELWKPLGQNVALFEESGRDPGGLYTAQDVRTMVNEYVTAHSLVHPGDHAYIIADDLIKNVLRKRGDDGVEFIRRDQVVPKIMEGMQAWHGVGDGKPQKGGLKHISIDVKMRAGRKAVTIITGFEAYSIDAEALSEELKTLCASSTTSGQIPGQAKGGTAMEVLVQGKHIPAVRDLLISKGVPKRMIQENDSTNSKKK